MTTQIAVNSVSIGQEMVSSILTLPNGQTLDLGLLGHVKEIRSQQVVSNEIKVQPITGRGLPILRNIYGEVSGQIQFSRFNGNISEIIAACFNNFFENGKESYFTLFCTVENVMAGNIDTYLYTSMVIGTAGHGDWASKEVDQEIPFRAQRLIIDGGYPDFDSLSLANLAIA